MNEKQIYMDYSATTPVDEMVRDEMFKYMSFDGAFGNPASRSHSFGWSAEKAVEHAREQVANTIHADPRDIIWTSGATESDNLALFGCMHFNQKKGKHLITCKTEHKAVLDACRQLEREGMEVTYLDVQEDGLISLEALKNAIRSDTVMVSIMHVNNEIGVIQPVKEIANLCAQNDVFFHMDAAQSIGKVDINVNDYPVHMISFSAHKAYGPKGIGALYIRRKPRVRLTPILFGGGHERGLRSGTLPTHQIVGMGACFEQSVAMQDAENKRLLQLRERFLEKISGLEEVYINGSLKQRIAGNLNVSFNYVEGESLIMAMKGIAVSSGSACTSASLEPSYVLRALGRSDELAHSSIRFTFGRYTTEEEIDYVADLMVQKVTKLRALSPLWDMFKSGVDLEKFTWSTH